MIFGVLLRTIPDLSRLRRRRRRVDVTGQVADRIAAYAEERTRRNPHPATGHRNSRAPPAGRSLG